MDQQINEEWLPVFEGLLRSLERLRRYRRLKRYGAQLKLPPQEASHGFDSVIQREALHYIESVYHRRGEEGLGQQEMRLGQEVKALQAHASRRAGDPSGDRRQSQTEWERWNQEDIPPRAVSPQRDWSRQLIARKYGYLHTLWLVATWVIMKQPPLEFGSVRVEQEPHPLSKREADIIRKAVDREWRQQRGKPPPRVPRGWWHGMKSSLDARDGGRALWWYPSEMVAEEFRVEGACQPVEAVFERIKALSTG